MENKEISLIGRYVKVLKSQPHYIASLVKGDYALLISEWCVDDLKGNSNSKFWNWNISFIGDYFELMPVGFKPYSYLLKEAIIKYPIGTKFKSVTTGKIFTVKNHDFNEGTNICFETIEPNGIGNHIGCVYSDGKWAEIVKESEFEENNWYECGDGRGFCGYLKLKKAEKNNYIYSERIWSNGRYSREEGSAKWNSISKANIFEIQKYLPDKHPDKIKTGVIAEYVKCIKGSGDCKYDILGKIYKVEDYDSNYGILKILGTNISNIFFGEKSLIDVNPTDYKISTKEEFEKQNKPTINLINTKIWIGDNPELNKKVQEKAFELGFCWNTGKKDLQYFDTKSLWFYEDKSIAFSYNRNYFESNKSKKEIFPSDLGIFTDVCEPKLEEYVGFPKNLEQDFKYVMGINLYKKDIKLGLQILPIDEPKHVKIIKRRETNF